jgi:hypothetical protein
MVLMKRFPKITEKLENLNYLVKAGVKRRKQKPRSSLGPTENGNSHFL